jgi:hypothetical protein
VLAAKNRYSVQKSLGVSTLLESCGFVFGDIGDIFVTTFPCYPRFASDLSERAQIKLMGPTLRAENNFTLRYNQKH